MFWEISWKNHLSRKQNSIIAQCLYGFGKWEGPPKPQGKYVLQLHLFKAKDKRSYMFLWSTGDANNPKLWSWKLYLLEAYIPFSSYFLCLHTFKTSRRSLKGTWLNFNTHFWDLLSQRHLLCVYFTQKKDWR